MPRLVCSHLNSRKIMTMPKCFSVYGYVVFFWSNEGYPIESVHVHIAQRMGPDTTKVWILSDGSVELANNNSHIPHNELRKIMKVIEVYSDDIVNQWMSYFNAPLTYHDLT